MLCVPCHEILAIRTRPPVEHLKRVSDEIAPPTCLAGHKSLTKKSDGKRIEGLCDQLLKARDPCNDIEVGTSSLRYATLAGYLWKSLNKATGCKDPDRPEPHESGRACLMPDGTVLFGWSKVWEEIGDAHDVQLGDKGNVRRRLLAIVGASDLTHVRPRLASGKRADFVSFDKTWLDALQALSLGGK